MNFDPLIGLLSDETTRKVFIKVLSDGRIRFGDLKRYVGDDSIEKAVEVLTKHHLVDKSEGPIGEFVTIYPTSEGLTLGRKMNLGSFSTPGSWKAIS